MLHGPILVASIQKPVATRTSGFPATGFWLLATLFDLGFFRRDAQGTQEAAIVDGHVERLAGNEGPRDGHALGRGVAAFSLGLPAIDEADDGLEIDLHLVAR